MMTFRNRYPWPMILIALLLLTACAAADMEGRPIDLSQSREGYLKDGLYHNDYFNFTWKAPLGWSPVKPTALEALFTRPDPNRGYMFGWANPALRAEIRFLVYPALPDAQGACSPQAAAYTVAAEHGWRALNEQPGQWQGHQAVQLQFTSQGLGQAGQMAVLARFVCLGQDLLVFQLQAPQSDYSRLHDLFQQLLSQVKFAGSPQEPKPGPPVAAQPELVHTVKSRHETLAAIAQWYTGKADLADRIKSYNQLTDPVRLSAGQQIKLPGELVTNRQPMPSYSGHKKSSAKRGRPRPEADDSTAASSPEPGGETLSPVPPTTPTAAPVPAGGMQLEPIKPR